MTSTVNAPMIARQDVTIQRPATPQAAAQLTIPKLHALTSLRFFAAAMIVMLHSQGYFGAIKPLARFTLTQGVCFFSCCPGLSSRTPIHHWTDVGRDGSLSPGSPGSCRCTSWRFCST